MRLSRRYSSVTVNRFMLAVTLLLVAVCMLLTSGHEVQAQTSVPAAPTGLNTASVSHDSVTLTWDDPRDNSITGYRLLRRSRDGDQYGDGLGAAEFAAVVVDTGSSATTYTDTSVQPRTRYVYRVKAVNPEGSSARSTYLNVETMEAPAAPPPTPVSTPEPTATPVPTPTDPAAPTGLAVSSTTSHSVTLNWNDPEDDSITSYQVLRRSRDGDQYGDGLGAAEFAAIVDYTGSATTTYTDASVTPSTRYVYRVKARNSQGLGESSGDANTETLDAPPDTSLPPVRGSRPNVVIILADDLGWGDVQTNNPDSAMTTPRIDSIAAAGAYFTDAHSPSSMCSPTRYGLLTGRYAWRSWLQAGVLGGSDIPLIGPDRATLGTLLQDHGYRTAAIGKWHLGMDFGRLTDVNAVTDVNRGIDFDAEIVDGPLDHGFDEFFGTSANLRWKPHIYIRDRRFLANPGREGQPASGFYRHIDVLDRLTEEAVAFIEREGQTEAPFFLYLPVHTPHVPLIPNHQFNGQTGLGRYADVVAQLDWTVGQVLDTLDRVGARENTLVIFTSDNGSYMGGIPVPNHVTHWSNGEWRGGKFQIHEGGHRVPLLMQWPRGIEAGSTFDATVSLTDLYATLADVLGEEPAPGVAPDSVSMLPLLRGEAETRAAPVVHHSGGGMFALRDGLWKLVFGNGDGGHHGSMIGFPFGEPWRLFNLEEDTRERNNLISKYPEVKAQMEAALERIRAAEGGTLSADATLKSLNLAGIDIGRFAGEVRSYNAIVDREVDTIEVTAIPIATDAKVTIAGLGEPKERGRRSLQFVESSARITISVTAPDRSATTTYTVTLTRSEEAPTITGTPWVGETQTADASAITDSDGLVNATFSYQWIRNNGSADSDIVGATGTTYLLAAEDEGKTIKVRVSFTDDGGNDETRFSAATAQVWEAYLESELTAGRNTDIFPVETGFARFGNLGGTLSPDEFVLEGTTYKVQFLVHSRESLWLGTSPELPADFTLFVGDSDYRGSESMVSETTTADAGYWWPSASPDWSADGPVRVDLLMHPGVPLGDRQKAPVTGYFRNYPSEHDGNTDLSFRIYFGEGIPTTADSLRDHVLSVSGGTVSGVEAVDDVGRIWAVSVTPESHHPVTVGIEADLDCQSSAAICTADGRGLFNRMALTVEPREKNPATGLPAISGTVEPGQTLTADTSAIADADGLTSATFNYQWVSYDGSAHTNIPGATDSTYTLLPADEGKAFGVRVSFADAAGNKQSLTSVLARMERPYGLDASESAGAVALTWKLPVGWTGSTFQILRNRPELGETEPLVHVRFAQTNGATYTDTDVEPGVLYVYRVKGVDPFGYTGEASGPVEIRTEATGAAPARPNVVLILADDLGWGDVQTNNPDSAMTTPRIDSIAAAGAHFTDAHSPSSVCTGTRYGLLTGRYSWRSWMKSLVLDGYDRPLIGPDRPTLGTLLQGHGYRTAAIGKWHLGMEFGSLSDAGVVTWGNGGVDLNAEIVDGPLDHGFDEFFGTSSNLNWRPEIYIRDRHFLANSVREGQRASGLYEDEDVLDRVTEEAVSFIKREGQTDEPFFLYLPLHSPHVPLAPNDRFDGLTGLGDYADVVAQIDWTVGKVLDTLDRVGARENTIVIFTSDNGSYMGGIPVPNHVDHQANGPWLGGKGTIHEGGHRVPLLMQWPLGIEAGSAVDATVSLTDLYATLANIVAEEPGPGVAPDSVSLLPLLSGEAVTRGMPVVHHSNSGMFALRDGRWKLVFGNGSGLPNPRHSRPFQRPWELFDMEHDRGESKSVAGSHSDVMARMEASLNQIRAVEDGSLSGDATLRSISLAGVDIGPFSSNVRSYAATVRRDVSTIVVTAIPTATDARVVIAAADGRRRSRGRLTFQPFVEPTTSFTISVTSPDTSATASYTVTVGRGLGITGTPQVGQILTADTSGIADADGLNNPGYSYQWVRNDGDADSDILGATGKTYVLMPRDEGKTILVRVRFTDDWGNVETRFSAATPTVRHPEDVVVWQTELTPGQNTNVFPLESGYSARGSLGGTLSPGSFEIDGTTYRVEYLVHSSESLRLGLDRDLPADFILIFGDFRLSWQRKHGASLC